ncbi:MAG: class I SAM-dependent methyltransferase [Pseudomonadota bacterium]
MSAIDCPACAAPAPAPRRKIARCPACGHRWMVTSAAARSVIEDTFYHHHYAGYRDDPLFRAAIRNTIGNHIKPRVREGASLLDVGCGAGDLLEAAVELGFEGRGIDISEASAERCRTRGLDAVSGDFLTYDFGRKFDVITMWDVMEHLRDPAAFLARVHDLLEPGGMYFAKVPGFGELSVGIAKAVPRAAGLLIDAPDHIQYFDRESLGRLAARMGFDADWLTLPRGARALPKGGSLKRRVTRFVGHAIRRASGDASLYLAATPRD